MIEMAVTLYYLGVRLLGEGEGGGFLSILTAELLCIISVCGFWVRKKGEASSVFRQWSVWLKLLLSIHIEAKSEKHIHNMKTISLFEKLYFNDFLNPTKHSNYTHWLQTDKPYQKERKNGSNDASFMSL